MFKDQASILPGPPHRVTIIQHICSKTIQRNITKDNNHQTPVTQDSTSYSAKTGLYLSQVLLNIKLYGTMFIAHGVQENTLSLNSVNSLQYHHQCCVTSGNTIRHFRRTSQQGSYKYIDTTLENAMHHLHHILCRTAAKYELWIK